MPKPVEDAPLAADGEPESGTRSVYDLAASDPHGELVDAGELSAADIEQVDGIMAAMARLRYLEQALSNAAQSSMAMNQTDLRAVQFLIVAENTGRIVTAGDLARHLGITTASTTKMLNRLERDGHIHRRPHPADRRAVAIVLAPDSRRRAIETVGRQQARRFAPAAALTPSEREIVRRFLVATADALEAGIDRPPAAR
ncbi:MarR family winged helix-turn-helix transcriptional regulator [Microlunatus sp. Gsoil 973]|uniref:MarR family winged helix-turn-helix transcriptional regulator n=1 Tax=Microlunatus sp. Gsoil 973 TaxID=2672569 RepID=UPI0012B46500|nr:MarR family transcriptional regulator [Microlunatus sp. Gsoil 973]QGN32038.1 MarR family transcriptional regulator [Microlunatus sp. Gsoil 973]